MLKTNSPAQVATALNVSRSSVCRAVKRIREHFLKVGIEKLPKPRNKFGTCVNK
jgi:hypothetical protein